MQLSISTPPPLLEVLQARSRELEEQYDLLPWEAYAAAVCHLSDWHVERALWLRDEQQLSFSRAIYEVKDWQPRPTQYLPVFRVAEKAAPPAPRPGVSASPPVSIDQARERLMASLCYYSLIRYKAAPGQPVIGIVVVCPGKGFAQARYNLCRAGILPRSKRWKRLESYLKIECETPPDTLEGLEHEREELLTRGGRWSSLLDMSPPQTVIASPSFLMTKLYEETLMNKSVVGTMSEREIDEVIGREAEHIHVSHEPPNDHHMIMKHLMTMDLDDIRYWMARLRQHSSPTSVGDRELLKDRLIYVIMLDRPGLAVVVDEILEDAKHVHNLI